MPLQTDIGMEIHPVAGHAVVLVKVIVRRAQPQVERQPSQGHGHRIERGPRHPVEQVGVIVDQFLVIAGVEREIGHGEIAGQQKAGNPGIHVFLLQVPPKLHEQFPGISIEAHVAEIEVGEIIGIADPVQGAPGLPVAQGLVDHPRGPVAAVGGVLGIAVIDIEKTEIDRGLIVSPAPVLSPLHVTPVGKDGLVEA